MTQYNFKNLVGQKFSRLTVIEYVGIHEKTRGALWKCLCDCGKYKIIKAECLKSSTTRSCGCYRKGCQIRTKSGETGLNNIYHTYKTNAKTRNLEFNLTKDEFQSLTKLNCYYCGIPPLRVSVCRGKYSRSIAINNSKYTYNGIDRINNTQGYTKENSRTCCKSCNIAKHTKTEQEFKDWITRVYNNFIKDKT